MNIRKICFFILMISTIGNSKASQEDKDKEEEKDLILCRALWRNDPNTFGTQIRCYSSDKNKIHHIEIADLKRFFFRTFPSKSEKLFFSKTDCLRFFAYSPDTCSGKSIGDLNFSINMDDEGFEKVKKEEIEKRELKEGAKDLPWEGFWENAREEIERQRKEAQLTRDYLEKSAESDEAREKILQVMSEEVDENWEMLKNAVLKEDPDQEEVLKLLELPRSLSQLPKLVAFKHVF